MPEKIHSREAMIIAVVGGLSVYALALLTPAIFNDGDTLWHIRAGQWMFAHRAVLDHDTFSLAFAGKFWETQEWLSELVLAGAFQSFGWSGIAIVTGLAMAAATASLAFYLARHLDPVPCIAVLVLALSCVMPDYLARPHILALPFLTSWVIGLAEAVEARRSPRWALLAVMVVWTNLHGSFVFGLALLLPFGAEAVIGAENDQRGRTAMNWILFAACSVAATLLNPWGLKGLFYPFELMQVQSLAAIGEWQSLDLHQFAPVEFAALAALFFLVWRGVKLPPLRLLLLLALFHLSLVHVRYGMLLGVAGAILVAGPLGATLTRAQVPPNAWQPRKVAAAALASLILVFTVLRIAYPIRRTDGPAWPVAALAAVPASLASQPVFNNYSFGGFLIFEGIKPLVDSRADFYGDDWLEQYARTVRADRTTVDTLFRKYRVAWTMLEPADPLVAALDHRPGWHRLFTNRIAVVQAGPAFPAPVTVSERDWSRHRLPLRASENRKGSI